MIESYGNDEVIGALRGVQPLIGCAFSASLTGVAHQNSKEQKICEGLEPLSRSDWGALFLELIVNLDLIPGGEIVRFICHAYYRHQFREHGVRHALLLG